MRPHIICHMLSSVDGKIDGASLKAVTTPVDYEATGTKLEGDAWVCGRTTMEQHFAEDEPFLSASNRPAGPQPVHVARKAKSYAISVDTTGKLRWASGDIDGDHLICIVSERAPDDYLSMLGDTGISYVVAGKSAVDLVKAVNLLGEHFGIRRLLLEGGGHINGAFLQVGLVDEVSLLLVPGIDGRREIPAVFDGMDSARKAAVPLKLKSIERRDKDALWLRYEVVR
ncbi:MAG: bifunctional deaminase-reductase domain protein [Bryobacterales bacterium]|nr:bifunctional deaminase-reductase domain protein [Bryobacterales bacterium]